MNEIKAKHFRYIGYIFVGEIILYQSIVNLYELDLYTGLTLGLGIIGINLIRILK